MRWEGAPPPRDRPLSGAERARVALLAPALAAVLGGGLALLLALRLVERPLCGARRPWTPWITQGVCVACCAVLGVRRRVRGRPMRGPGAQVANHVGWMDVLVLNASARPCFVAKSEVRGWPGIGWLARATGTAFIDRRRADAPAQRAALEARLAAGQLLLFFPEGTSTDGRRVLPFRTALFEALLAPGLGGGVAVQPVTLAYRAPPGERAEFFGWWGEMALGPSLARTIARGRGGVAEVVYHPQVPAAGAGGRKALGAARGGNGARGAGGGAGPRGQRRGAVRARRAARGSAARQTSSPRQRKSATGARASTSAGPMAPSATTGISIISDHHSKSSRGALSAVPSAVAPTGPKAT